MKSSLSRRFAVTLFLFSLVGQIAWVVENMYFNVFLYKMFHATPDAISAMVSASAVAAAVTTVFMGALSDKVGKRKLFIWLGYVLWGLSIIGFLFLNRSTLSALFPAATSIAAIGVTLTVVLDCVMTFFGSTANDAAFNAFVTDATEEGNRGKAEGINAMMPLIAILVVFGSFMFFDLDREESWRAIFLIIGTFVMLVGVVGLFLIREPQITPSREGYFKSVLYGFFPSTVKKNPTLYLTLLAFLIFNVSIQIFMPYLILYYEVSLGMKDYVFIMAPAILVAAAVTFFWGRVYDKKGLFFSASLSLTSLVLGYMLLFFFRGTVPVFIGSLLMMIGYLAGMAVFGAHIRSHTPRGKAGLFQGVRIFSQVLIPGVIGPYVGKLLLANAETVLNSDGTRSFIPNATLFLGAAVAAVVLIPFLFLLKNKKGAEK
ncbi:MAG: MFS transporter [Clostridia bacterium]|nr:MFS transporter [Clostridia bacterium]